MTTPNTEHLDPEVVAAFAEGTLPEDEADAVRRHLAECPECRREIQEVARILAAVPTRPRRPVPTWAAAAAVAILALGIPLLRWGGGGTGGNGLRAPVTEFETLGPGQVRAGDPGGIRFTWSAGPAGSTFRITLLDEQGDRIWSSETGDTTVLLPAEVPVMPGGSYYWYVDALAPDGRTLTAGPTPLEVR